MKSDKLVLSRYNCFKEYDDRVVGLNLCNKMLFALDREKYDLLLSYENDPGGLEEADPVFFSTMYKLGIIRQAAEDAQYNQRLLLENRKIVFSGNMYELTINPTLNCNFSCWYCYETHTKKRMTKPVVEATIKHITNIILSKRYSVFTLNWFGGEPLLCLETVMRPISQAAKELCEANGVHLQSSITTNGYLIDERTIRFFEEYNMFSLQITLDGKKEQHDKTRFCRSGQGSYDRIVGNICRIAGRIAPRNLAMRINFTVETFPGIFEIIDTVPKEYRNKITVLLQQVWQDKEMGKLDVAEIDRARQILEEAGFLSQWEILETKGYRCYADLATQALINYDGRVFKCTARNFEKDREDGILSSDGEIIWNEMFPRKINKATFENDRCMPCKYLPVCFGPCSNKTCTVRSEKDFDRFCFEGGMESTLDYIMDSFAENDLTLAPIFGYR